jgi:16S rRNA processing protein RimM
LDQTPTEPDAWYDQQLVGLKVYRDGEQIGTVARVEHLPAQDLLVVDYNETEVMVPFVKQLVPEVNVAENRVVITPPLGLFEDIEEDQ